MTRRNPPSPGYSGLCVCPFPNCPGLPMWMVYTLIGAWGLLAVVAPLFFTFMAYKIVVGP
jgi:hypothetical protein